MPSCFTVFRFVFPKVSQRDDPPLYSRESGGLKALQYDSKSLDSSSASVGTSEYAESLEKEVDNLSAGLRTLSLKIHAYKETKWEETKTAKALVDFLKKQIGNKPGYKVTTNTGGLPTAWKAVYTSPGTVNEGGCVGFNSEMDALPGVGHACGHNLIAIVGVAAFLALSRTMAKYGVAGSCILLGTPAEEDGGGKINLIEKGEYKDMDLCLMGHPGMGDPHNGSVTGTLAVAVLTSKFIGHTAHAAAAPWEGINALDAAVTTYNSLAVLRQQVPPTHRLHSVIKSPPEEPFVQNIIPGSAIVEIGLRAPTYVELDKFKTRVQGCVSAGAVATGCKVESSWLMSYKDTKLNFTLAEEYQRFMSSRQDVKVQISTAAAASTDFGDVSYALPGLQVGFDIPAKAGNHTPEFTKAAATIEAHESAMKAAKGLAAVGWKAQVDKEWRESVKAEFKNERTV